MESETKRPECIGFILDGNRRWAKSHGLPTLEGHRKGYDLLEAAIEWMLRAEVPHMVCYVFSTENWNRSAEEVSYLMNLLQNGVHELLKKQKSRKEKVNIRFIGERTRLDPKLVKKLEEVEQSAYPDPDLTVWVALSYGGRSEIVAAVNAAIRNGVEVTEESFAKLLWSAGMPDPDIIIRTSGEQRLSNFLPWQSVYSELFFTETLWPDFTEEEFQRMLEAYGTRTRRKGT